MSVLAATPRKALQYEAEVSDQGQVVLCVPFQSGVRVRVFVMEDSPDDFCDLLEATQSSVDFWENPFDDEDWNDC